MNEMIELLSLERRLWSGGAEEFKDRVDNNCLLAFSQGAGVSKRDDVAKSVQDSTRWTELELKHEGFLQPTDDIAMIAYRATAARGRKEQYRALVTSGYVKRNGEWKLMFHQHTPLEGNF